MVFYEEFLKWVSDNYTLISMGLLVAFLIALFIFIIIIFQLQKIRSQYKKLVRGVDGKNLEEIILHNTKTLEKVLLNLEISDQKMDRVEKLCLKSIRRVGVLRFNAFQDMGGDLSYAIAFLDENGDGLIISSIYGRDDSRTYAKPVRNGKSTYQLSKEELNAIEKALNNE